MRPAFVVMHDPDVAFIRQLEVWLPVLHGLIVIIGAFGPACGYRILHPPATNTMACD